MGRRILLIGLAVLSAVYATWTLVQDLTGSSASDGGIKFRRLGELWYEIDPEGLNLAQVVVERYLWGPLWDPGAITLLLIPVWAVFSGLGLLFWQVARRA